MDLFQCAECGKMMAFQLAWDSIMKMPFVPGSVREAGVDEGDENYEDRKRYEAEFYDPVDDKTRKINILPTWKKRPKDEGFKMSLFGSPTPEGTTVDIELDEDEMREPEQLFGRGQQVPFGYFYRNANLDRLFTPSHLRQRGMGTGIVDAMQEYREKILGITNDDWRQITDDSDNLQTEDMFRFWHKRGYMPQVVYPVGGQSTIGDENYYQRKYVGMGKEPDWTKQGPNTEPFEEAWQNALHVGQLELGSKREREEIYRRCEAEGEKMVERLKPLYPDLDEYDMMYRAAEAGVIGWNEIHSDGSYDCDCWAGHPWYESEGENMELHEARKHLYPNAHGEREFYEGVRYPGE
jgi:hypothetical protein